MLLQSGRQSDDKMLICSLFMFSVLFSGVSYSCSVDKLKHLYLEETLLFRSKNTLDTKERHARAVLFRSKYIEGLLPRVHSEPQVKVLIGTLIRWIGEEGKEDEKQQLSNLLLYSIPVSLGGGVVSSRGDLEVAWRALVFIL